MVLKWRCRQFRWVLRGMLGEIRSIASTTRANTTARYCFTTLPVAEPVAHRLLCNLCGAVAKGCSFCGHHQHKLNCWHQPPDRLAPCLVTGTTPTNSWNKGTESGLGKEAKACLCECAALRLCTLVESGGLFVQSTLQTRIKTYSLTECLKSKDRQTNRGEYAHIHSAQRNQGDQQTLHGLPKSNEEGLENMGRVSSPELQSWYFFLSSQTFSSDVGLFP